VAAFLVWLWISNLVVLLGAELNAEIERGRQLEAGLPAERRMQVQPRDEPK
jgi:membrane protein